MNTVLFILPFLFLLVSGIDASGQEVETINLYPTDDSFVLTNLHDPSDRLGFNDMHFDKKDFLKIWYTWNSTGHNEKIFSGGFVKFDISKVDVENIQSARLNLKPFIVMTDGVKEISVNRVLNNTWTESNLSYNTKPNIDITQSQTIQIPEPDQWYSWDVTNQTKQTKGDYVSFSMVLTSLVPEHEEQIVFHSKESETVGNSPYLEIQYMKDSENPEGGGCLVATAAFGTELAPQIQQLRELRDNTLLETKSGSAFMAGFNQLYYLFSPTVADWERQNPLFKEVVKLSITPMVSTLSILDNVEINSEAEMITYGISLITLNMAMYAGIPAFAIYMIKKNISF